MCLVDLDTLLVLTGSSLIVVYAALCLGAIIGAPQRVDGPRRVQDAVVSAAAGAHHHRHGLRENGHPRTVTDPLGNTTHVRTDAAGLVTEVRAALGAVTRHERDMFGRVVATVDPLGGVTRYGWTVEGRPSFRALPDGRTERWRYDGESNEVEYVDAAGEVTRTEITHFDVPGARTAADGTRTTYTYDSELRLTQVTNPAGLEWHYEYDGPSSTWPGTGSGGTPRTGSHRRGTTTRWAARPRCVPRSRPFSSSTTSSAVRSGAALALFR